MPRDQTKSEAAARDAEAVIAASRPKRSKADKILTKMRSNPRGDWTIQDMQIVAAEIGLVMSPPSRGSHFKVTSEHSPQILTVPAKKPIKAPYVRQFVTLCRTHVAQQEKVSDNGR